MKNQLIKIVACIITVVYVIEKVNSHIFKHTDEISKNFIYYLLT